MGGIGGAIRPNARRNHGKSWIDKAGMYIFERKARFYEQRHQRQADRLIVISPMIDARAQPVAKRLGIETYGDSLDVEIG